MLLQVPVEVSGLNPLKDKSWKLVFVTQRELSGAEVSLLADNFQGLGHILFSANPAELTADKVPTTVVESNGKTPSARLRDVLYILWVQRGKTGGAFDPWYAVQMEKFIDAIKAKLEPES